MTTVTIQNALPIDVVKRAIYIAYRACGMPSGMGIFQHARLEGKLATEEQVWQCAYNAEDYPGGRKLRNPNEVYADYVFGKMVKWGCSWDNTVIFLSDRSLDPAYQGFASRYPTEMDLISVAAKELKADAIIEKS